jgi:hypothetical protein
MTSALTFRALAALPLPLQAMARQHIEHHPTDDLGELVSEIAIALAELADAATDRVFARARSRLRRQSQDPAHYAAGIDDAHHDIERDDEPSALCRRDIVRDVAARQHVTARRAQQLVKQQLMRAAMGDLFATGG